MMIVLSSGAGIDLEARGRERHSAEEFTGIIVVSRGIALLLRYAIICSLDEKLSRSFNPDYRKYTEGNVKPRTII